MTTHITLSTNNLEFTLTDNEPSLVANDVAFGVQASFYNMANILTREVRADLESILARIPKGYKITIEATGGECGGGRYNRISSEFPQLFGAERPTPSGNRTGCSDA